MIYRKLPALMMFFLIILFLYTACGQAELTQPGESGTRDAVPVSGLYPAQVSHFGDQKWGYIDSRGEFILKPVYSQAGLFQSNGLAAAGTNERVGLIDKNGRYVVEPVYSYIGEFLDGLAVAQDSKGSRVIDEKGKVLSDTYDFIGSYSDGRAVFYKNSGGDKLLYGYLDTAGNVAIEPKYDSANDFNEGTAVVGITNGKFALIDRNGGEIKTYDYSYVGSMSDGLMPFREKQDGKSGYINENGTVAIGPKFYYAGDFKDGVAIVDAREDVAAGKYGLIDKKGGYIIKTEYNDMLDLGEGMLAVGVAINGDYPFIGSRYAVADKTGKILTDFIYYGIDKFNNGIASAFDNTTTFFIDKTGKRIESLPSVKGTGSLSVFGSLVKADVDKRLEYLDTAGKVIFKPSDHIKLKNGVVVSEIKYRPNRNYLVYYPVLSGLASQDAEISANRKLAAMSVNTGISPIADLDYSYEGDFTIGFYAKNLLVLEMTAYNYPFGAAHGMPVEKYAHVDIKTGGFYELKNLFRNNSDYVKVLSDIIRNQIVKNGEKMGIWSDSYKGINPDQPFYITKDALKIYFEPYEIAPYAAGFPTFSIPYGEIMDIINTDGSFWRSFNP